MFVLGLTLQYIFAVELGWLPAGGRIDPRANLVIQSNFVLIDSLLMGRPDLFVDGIRHLILPAIALGSIPLAIITRITRASVLDVTNEDHVRTARAKGLTEKRVNSRHIMRNAWLPVVTVIGIQVGGLLGGRRHHRDGVRLGRRRAGSSSRPSTTVTTSWCRTRSSSSPSSSWW